MARWLTTIEIAGIVFTGCRGELIDAEKMNSSYVGSVTWANTGSANANIVNVGRKGNAFGIRMNSAQVSKILQVETAVAITEGTGSTFAVKAIDDMYNLHVYSIKDYSRPKWMTHGKISEGWAENVEFRMICKANV
jgi:hypothetical protein